MKVGDYIRTKNGISKVKEIHEIVTTDNEYITTLISTDNGTCGEENVIKYSQNIIDLIEVGDYVNGSEVCKIYNNSHLDNPKKEIFCIGKDGFEGELIYTNNDIKSIVTREQFEAMQYKVGE